MRKRKNIVSALTLAVLAAASCARDLGNYTYRELDAPVISGVEESYEVLTNQVLSIDVGISEGLPEQDYTYEWMVIDNNNDNEKTVIGTERDLNYTVLLPPGSYSMYYTLTEKSGGIMWRTESSLTVNSSMSEGWMVLCSDSGRARLDFISDVTGETYSDILPSRGVPQMNGPRRIQWLPSLTDESSPYYLLTDDGATRLGKNDFEWAEQFAMRYESAELTDLKPYSISCSGFGKVIVSGDGIGANSAHYCEIMGISGLYGSRVNSFNVAPAVGANVLAGSVYAAVYLLYDTDNGKFMAYCPLLTRPDLGSQSAIQEMDAMGEIAQIQNGNKEGCAGVVEFENGFSDYPVGMEYVYMENTRYDPGNASMGVTYTILADGQKRYVYGIQCGDMLTYSDCTYVLGKAVRADISACGNITEEGNLYAFSSLRKYMYYSSGGSLYRADLSESEVTSELQLEFPGEKITCLKFNLYHNSENSLRSYDLIVGTEDASGNGTVRIYEGYSSAGNFSGASPFLTFTGASDNGFTSITDVTYKERIY